MGAGAPMFTVFTHDATDTTLLLLRQLVERYPGKPVFVDASVDGPPSEKAHWLSQFGAAVTGLKQVYAVLYHEGGPDLNPTPASIRSWSLTSDGASLNAMKQVVADLHRVRRPR